jgi:hypothetical protein
VPTVKKSLFYWVAASVIFTALLTTRNLLDGDAANPLPIFIITLMFSLPGVVILYLISKVRYRRRKKHLDALNTQASQELKKSFLYRPRKTAYIAIPLIFGLGCAALFLAINDSKPSRLFGVIPLTPSEASALLFICGISFVCGSIYMLFRFYKLFRSDRSLMLIELGEEAMTLRLNPWDLVRTSVNYWDIADYRKTRVQGNTIIKFKHKGKRASITQAFFENEKEFMTFLYSLNEMADRLKKKVAT